MTTPASHWRDARNLRLAARLDAAAPQPRSMGLAREGVLRRAVGLTLEASGCSAPLGSRCRVETHGGVWVDAEVVGFSGDRTFLMPSAHLEGLLPNARVVPSRQRGEVAVGEGLLGRVIDSDGVPLDGRGPIRAEHWVGLAGASINPLMREPITRSLDVGVRAINALLPIGRGQRVGLFAGSGVGKSTLLGMMTRFTAADVIVVGLIGERGREVRDFVEATLGEKLPRPPKDVPLLPDEAPAEGLTVRQLVERHTSDERCAGCHRRIDPFGFALESYDAIGRRRPKDPAGQPLDTRTRLPDGTDIDGMEGLRQYLLTTRRDAFVRQFCRKLLGYALGRGVQLSDEPLLDEMQQKLAAGDYRFSIAIETIVQSRQFREIRGRQAPLE